LDNASTKLGVIYGVTDGLSLHLSRETNQKTFEGGAKYKLLKQSENFPLDIVGYNVLAVNTDLSKDNYRASVWGQAFLPYPGVNFKKVS
jgi:hypothetical protein